MAGLLAPKVEEKVIGTAEILEIFKVSKVGKVAGSKVLDGEIKNNFNARIIRDGSIIYNGKIDSIFREKNQAKEVTAGLECGITLKDFNDYQKKDIIEVYNSTSTERTI
jgi:translation initiation factor IF-2